MRVLKPYNKLFDKDNHYIMLKSGRDAGKSKALSQLIVAKFFELKYDIIVCRANYGDLQGSMYNEIIAVLEEEGLYKFVLEKKKPLKLINNLNGNTIYFQGVGGADLSRTKGLKTRKKVSLIIIDETQQLPRQDNLDQALATLRRHLNPDDWKIILAFNPERQNSHWTNEYYRINESLDSWLCIHTSYKNIAKVLTKTDLEAIRLEKEINPSNYRYLYLGETDGLFGGVYHTFNRQTHLIREAKVRELIKTIGIFSVLIGVDGATTRDKTAFVPTIILNNGQGIVLNYFYHDPIKTGAYSNDRLFPFVERWLDDLHYRWSIPPQMRIDMIFDSASVDLRLVSANRLPSRYVCTSYSQKNIVQMAHIMQNAFGRNVLYILDEDGVHNYISNRKEYGLHPLVTQLESVIWDEQGKKFDPIVPNDCTDALTYSTAFYFRNPNALYFPKMQDYYERSEKD